MHRELKPFGIFISRHPGLVMNTSRNTQLASLMAIVMLALLSSGCGGEVDSWLTYFSYKEHGYTKYEEPEIVAVGAKIEFQYNRHLTFPEPSTGMVALNSVTSSNPDVIKVVNFHRAQRPFNDDEVAQGGIVLKALAPGTATIHVVDLDDNELEAVVHAAKAVKLVFVENDCVTGERPPLTGQRIRLFDALYDKQGNLLYSWEFRGDRPPYDMEPAGAIDSQDIIQAPRGTITLKSVVDDTRLEFPVIGEQDIVGAELDFNYGGPDMLHVANSLAFEIYATRSNGRKICHSDLDWSVVDVQVTELTPDICRKSYLEDISPLWLEMLEPGTCRLKIEMPQTNHGQGITLTPEFEVQPRQTD